MNPGPVVGADGRTHTATCSGYPGTDATFSFWAKRGKSKNLVVYFEGGGACWDNQTCTFPLDSRVPDLLRVAAKNLPDVQVAQFTTAMDTVQVAFYGAMKTFYPPGGSYANPAIDWYRQMRDTLATYVKDVPNFRRYVAAGDYHTILRSPLLYTEASAGPAFHDWLEALLERPDRRRRHANVACETCLVEVPCP